MFLAAVKLLCDSTLCRERGVDVCLYLFVSTRTPSMLGEIPVYSCSPRAPVFLEVLLVSQL